MKRNFKLLVLTLVAIFAMTLGIAFGATAENLTDAAKTTVYTNWWTNDTDTNFADNKFTIDERGQEATAFADRQSAEELRENRYTFTLTVSAVDSNSEDFYFTFDARGHASAPWGTAANSVYLRLHKGYFVLSGQNLNYATDMNIADGQPHTFDIVINDEAKTVALKIDDASYAIKMEQINSIGRTGFMVNQSSVVIDSPSVGFTAKEENTDAMTEWTNWWGSLSFDKYEGTADERVEASHSGLTDDYNRYKFTLTISKIQDGADSYFYIDARGHAPAPYNDNIVDGSVWLRLHVGGFYFCDKNEPFNYAKGQNLTDGNPHEFEIIIDDVNKTATLWIDNAYYKKTLDTINSSGTFGLFGLCSTGEVSKIYAGYTATSIDVTQADGTTSVKMEDTLALTATLNPTKATTPVTWSSENNAIATVDNNGVVTGVAEGTVNIKATTATGLVDTYEVTVVSNVVNPTGIELDKTAETLSKTDTLQLNVTFTPADTTNKGIDWTTSDANVATVENGLVTVVASSGTATITATSAADPNVTATCTITAAPLNATAVTAPSTIKLEVGDIKKLNYSVEPAAADDTFTVTVTDDAKVSYENGKLTALTAGETTVTITSNVNSEIKTTITVTVIEPTAPDGMPTFNPDKELDYVIGCDPSVKDTLTVDENGFVCDTTAYGTGVGYFPIEGNIPATTYSMNAIQFALKIDTEDTSDWVAAVLFRTASPSTVFYANPTGIGLCIYHNRIEVHLRNGSSYDTLTNVTDVTLADGLTHYYAIEVVGNVVSVWIDGEKVVDNSDQSEAFGNEYNIAKNNSFSIAARLATLTVSDLHIYDTNYSVTTTKTGSGTVTVDPEGTVVKDTPVTVTVTAAQGSQVKSVKVNGEDATLTDGKLSLTITEDTTIAVEFEKINSGESGGDEGGGDGEGPTVPEGMPTFDASKELSYVIGCDPDVEDTLTISENGFVCDTTAYGAGVSYFPIAGNVPATSYSMTAIEFALQFDTQVESDWAAAVLFRTKAPSTAFYSNPSGVEICFYLNETHIRIRHGRNTDSYTEVAKITNLNLVDGTTHYFAIEVVGNVVSVWIDGEKVVDNSDQSEAFGNIFNVDEENSFSIMTRLTTLTVSDLHIYDTAVRETKYNVSATKTGSGTVIGVPESAVAKDTTVTVTVTAAEGWKVKSVKVNGTEKTLTDGKLSLTITEDTSIAVEFEEISSEGNGNENDGKKNKSGCGSSIAFASSMMAIIALGGAGLMLKKKNN